MGSRTAESTRSGYVGICFWFELANERMDCARASHTGRGAKREASRRAKEPKLEPSCFYFPRRGTWSIQSQVTEKGAGAFFVGEPSPTTARGQTQRRRSISAPHFRCNRKASTPSDAASRLCNETHASIRLVPTETYPCPNFWQAPEGV